MAETMSDSGAPGAAIRDLGILADQSIAGLGVRISALPRRDLVSLRVEARALDAVSQAIGLALPTRPKSTSSEGERTAFWLGPDEWFVVADNAGDGAAAASLIETVDGLDRIERSAVDVSHRFAAIAIEGKSAAAVLAAGCPQDLRLAAFPVGAASRSVFAKAEVIVWRTAETRFEIFCVRSFAPYVFALLAEAAKSPAI